MLQALQKLPILLFFFFSFLFFFFLRDKPMHWPNSKEAGLPDGETRPCLLLSICSCFVFLLAELGNSTQIFSRKKKTISSCCVYQEQEGPHKKLLGAKRKMLTAAGTASSIRLKLFFFSPSTNPCAPAGSHSLKTYFFSLTDVKQVSTFETQLPFWKSEANGSNW